MTMMQERTRLTPEPQPYPPEPHPQPGPPAPDGVPDGLTHLMHGLDHTGDSVISWTPGNATEVAAARNYFARMTRRRSEGGAGHLGYRTDEGGERAEQLREFDPQARRIMFAPPLEGG